MENMKKVKNKYLKHINSQSLILDVGGRGLKMIGLIGLFFQTAPIMLLI